MLEISQLCLRYADTRIRKAAWRARLAASIAQQGQLSPVLVHREKDEWVLIDGYARIDALQDLGQDHVRALTLEMSPAEALLTRHRLQGGRRPSAIEEGWLLRILVDEYGLRPREVAAELQRSPSWVSRRLALVAVLPETVQATIRRGELCPQAAMKSLVPLARANAEHCERLVAALVGDTPSVRDLDHIYRAWREASAAVRERIVAHPQLLLRAAKVTTPAPVSPGSPIVEGLRELQRCTEQMVPLVPTSPSPRALDGLRDAWTRTCHAFERLEGRMDTFYARRGDSAHHPSTRKNGPRQACHLEDAEALP